MTTASASLIAPPPNKSHSTWIANSLSLNPPQIEKVVSVALSTFYLLYAFHIGLALSLPIVFTTIALTWLSEKKLGDKHAQKEWFQLSSFSLKESFKAFLENKFYNILIAIGWVILSTYGLCLLPSAEPIQIALDALSKINKIEFIFSSVIAAPIFEEIFFRGFVKERIEDLGYLFSTYICHIPDKTREKIVNIVQACLFGYAHVIYGQVKKGFEVFVFLTISVTGYILGSVKTKTNSLLSSIFVHTSENFLSICNRI